MKRQNKMQQAIRGERSRYGLRPVFTEPNALVCQVKQNGNWVDFASIKTTDDLYYACRRVENTVEEYRIIVSRPPLFIAYPPTAGNND